MYGTYTYITGGIESHTRTDDSHDHNIIYKKCGFRQAQNILIEKTLIKGNKNPQTTFIFVHNSS